MIKKTIVILGVTGCLLILITRPPPGLSVEAYRAVGVFVLALSLWCTTALPLAVTSLLAIVLLPLFGIIEGGQAFSFFGNRAVFFILGAFILAAAMMKNSRRCVPKYSFPSATSPDHGEYFHASSGPVSTTST